MIAVTLASMVTDRALRLLLLKRLGAAIPRVFSSERHFHAPCGAGSLAVGKCSGCVFQPQGRTHFGNERCRINT